MAAWPRAAALVTAPRRVSTRVPAGRYSYQAVLAILAPRIPVLNTILGTRWKSLENDDFRCVKSHIEIPYKTNGKVMILMIRVQDLASNC